MQSRAGKEGKASGSWQHSPLHSKGPTVMVPSTPSAPTKLGFQGKGPLVLVGAEPQTPAALGLHRGALSAPKPPWAVAARTMPSPKAVQS